MVNKGRDSGQVALILVLVMTVIASAAVSLSGRTTVETRIQEINIDSSQAQIAAEAGLEQALRNAPTGTLTGSLDANTTFSVGNNVIPADQGVYRGIKRGETVEINLVGASGNPTSVNVYWSPVGNDPDFVTRAVYITEVRPTGLTDYAFDTLGTAGSGFALAGSGALGFDYGASVPIDSTSTSLRVTALGGDMDIGFVPDVGALAPQLINKPVVGTVTRGTDLATQERIQYGIDYSQSIVSEVPEVFEYALFSGQSISQ